MQFRQGDVLIEKCDAIPANAKPQDDKDRVVLAYGEVTGHAHAFYGANVTRYLADEGGGTFIRVKKAAKLKHEEHSTINVPPGDYRVIRQREYSPEEIRQVAD